MTEDEYLQSVYKSVSDSETVPDTFKSQIQLFFPRAPKSLIQHAAATVRRSSTRSPPTIGELWTPMFLPKDVLYKTLHPPANPHEYALASTGFASNSTVEVVHVDESASRDFDPGFAVFGLWGYIAPGSGLAVDLGKTLVAKNKIHMLHKLGMSQHDIATMIKDSYFMLAPSVLRSVGYIAQLLQPKAPPSDAVVALVQQILHEAETGTIATLKVSGKQLYLDTCANSPDWDALLTILGKQQGFDSLQLTVQRNGKPGYTHEIVLCGMDPIRKVSSRTESACSQHWWNWLRLHTYMYDPVHKSLLSCSVKYVGRAGILAPVTSSWPRRSSSRQQHPSATGEQSTSAIRAHAAVWSTARAEHGYTAGCAQM